MMYPESKTRMMRPSLRDYKVSMISTTDQATCPASLTRRAAAHDFSSPF